MSIDKVMKYFESIGAEKTIVRDDEGNIEYAMLTVDKPKHIRIPKEKIGGITTNYINENMPKGLTFMPNCAVVTDEEGNAHIVSTCGFRHLDDLELRMNMAIENLSKLLDVNNQ